MSRVHGSADPSTSPPAPKSLWSIPALNVSKRVLLLALVFSVLVGSCTETDEQTVGEVAGTPSVDAIATTTTTHPTCEFGPRWTAGTDLIIFMRPSASRAAIDALEQELRDSVDIDSLTFTNQTVAFAEFQEMFLEDANMLASLTLSQLPTRFNLDLAESNDAVIAALRTRFGADPRVMNIVEPPTTCPPTSEQLRAMCKGLPAGGIVFLNPDASQADIDRVGEILATAEFIDTVEFDDQAQAYEDFQVMFQDAPEIVRSTGASDMPASFRIESDADLDALLGELANDPAVFAAIDGGC